MHFLKTEQTLPIGIQEAWKFFSSPDNLKSITPPRMGFYITSGYREDKMYPGMIITYIVKPLLGIPVKWVTEITHVSEPNYFVDEQRFGPYSFWHHQHKFFETDGGVRMVDVLHYRIKFGFIGRIVNRLFVEREVKKIFEYRRVKLQELFG